MAALRFQVEVVLPGRGYLIARQLDEGAFRLVEGSALAGCPLDPRRLDIPRAKNPDGTPRMDLFAFRLRQPGDAERFKPGDLVELSGCRG